MNLEDLTFKQIVNCIAMIKQLKETGILEFDVNTTAATLNYDETIRYLEKQNLNLSEENKKNKEYSEFYKDMSDKWKNMSDVLKKSCEEYKSKNEKAIEFCKKYDFILKWQLLEILEGEDKDVKD